MANNYSFKVGDVVKITQKIVEGKKERNSSFKGQVLKVKGKGDNKMFTVRQNIEGVDVDKIYPYTLPSIIKIEVVGKPKKKIKHANLMGTYQNK